MAFNVSEITNTGLELISAASATKTIVIDHIYCLSIQAPEAEILTQPPSYWANHASIVQGVNASVVSVGVDPNASSMSRIVLGFTLGIFASRTVKTVVVTAHSTEAGTDSEEMTFYGMADSTGLFVPYSSKTSITTQLAISFAFSRESSITVSGSVENYLLADETARFVTTHGTSSTVVGDNQSIYGKKSFESDIVINKYLMLGNTGENQSVAIRYDRFSRSLQVNYLEEYEDGESVLNIINTAVGESIASISVHDENYRLNIHDVNSEYIHVHTIESDTDVVILDSSISPLHNNTVNLGSSIHKFMGLYSSNGVIDNLTTDEAEIAMLYTGVIDSPVISYHSGEDVITSESSIIPKSSASVFQSSKDLGASNAIWRYLYVSTAYCTSIYCSQSIGSESSKVSDIYADRIHGMTPYPSKTGTTVNVPIGCFVMAAITRSINSSWRIGDDFYVSSNTVKISMSSDSGWIAGNDYLPEGKYRALHEGNVTGSGSVPCLLQRLDPSKT